MFTEQSLRKGLHTRVFGQKIYTFETLDSTNNCAKAVAGCGALEGTVVISEEQTEGKGRLGRVWQANPNENLTFSVVLRPRILPESINLLSLYVAVAAAQAVEKVAGVKVECKWPNDLLIKGKKFGGILIEASIKQNTVEYVVVGVGINVNQRKFPAELQAKATSLLLARGKTIDRPALLRETLSSLEQLYATITSKGPTAIVPHWLSRTSILNKSISVSQQGTIISGVVTGLTDEGGLILRSNGSEKKVYAGDVTVVAS